MAGEGAAARPMKTLPPPLLRLTAILCLAATGCAGPPMQVVELDDFRGQAAYEVRTPSATWVYHRQGAGLAALLDPDGVDWVGYSEADGPAGSYRGLPNLIHPENEFHPGGGGSSSTVVEQTGERVAVESQTADGAWAGRWEFGPSHARFRLTKAPRPYWFVYEGAPNGGVDFQHGYYMLSNGWRRPIGAPWSQDLPDPEWIVFGDDRAERVLLLMQVRGDLRPDHVNQMQQQMVVFGFGRESPCCSKYLDGAPAEFVVALVESSDYGAIRAAAEALR
ncbi:MAG: hypothetical protein GC160_19705 [Acidobacteria bacterium]|nr:hypothetical protein [Acidobacteriota bacterium]